MHFFNWFDISIEFIYDTYFEFVQTKTFFGSYYHFEAISDERLKKKKNVFCKRLLGRTPGPACLPAPALCDSGGILPPSPRHLHHTLPHLEKVRHITPNYAALRCITPHYAVLRRFSPHYAVWRPLCCVTPHHAAKYLYKVISTVNL